MKDPVTTTSPTAALALSPTAATASSSPPASPSSSSVAIAAVPAATALMTAPPSVGPAASEQKQTQRRWNTKNLGLRLGSDFASATCAGSLVAPLISVIDRSIMENASGRNTLLGSIRSSFTTLLTRPHAILFSKPAALILMLYGGTYLTANTLDTATSTIRARPATTVTTGTAKFAASSTANISICIYKDQAFVRMFGPPGAVPRPVTPASYLLFALRDCFTIFASFNVPPVLGPYLDTRMSAEMRRAASGAVLAQFVAPAAVQLLSTPIHLLGLDLYNRPASGPGAQGVVTARDRWDLIRKAWAPSALARICRIVPAFGVGGVVNNKMRKNLMDRLV